MARNAEKAMTTLARWRQAKLEEESGGPKKRRPYLASQCDNLKECEQWRLEIIREISKKVTQIQNAGLGEFRIRDLNDQINKALREKRHWENRITELGGRQFRRQPGPDFEKIGRPAPGARGYKYFGAAKDLPGVRELFEQEITAPPRKTRAELMQNIDADYYGYRDEDDGVIVPQEKEAEKKIILEMCGGDQEEADRVCAELEGRTKTSKSQHLDDEDEGTDFEGPKTFVSHVPFIPSQKEVEAELLRRKKQQLLELYVGTSSASTSSADPQPSTAPLTEPPPSSTQPMDT